MNKSERLKSLASMFGDGGAADSLRKQFEGADAAADSHVVPPGVYRCLVLKGELRQSRQGTAGYRVTFCVDDGEFRGARLYLDCWLTEKAMPMSKRDLLKLGVTSVSQLEQPLSQGLVADVTVVRYQDDEGAEHNRVRTFAVVDRRRDPTADEDFPSAVNG